MGSVQPYKTKQGKRYLVRYKKPDGTHASKRGFHTKFDAQQYLATVDVAISTKRYIDPMDARVSVGELAAVWLQDQAAVLKPSSFHPLQSAWRVHVAPRWAGISISDVRYSDVRGWVTELSQLRGPATVIRSYGILSAVLDAAVRDRRIAENPARGVRLPKKVAKRRVYLTHAQVHLLASQASHPEVVLFLAYTGLRWGEATALRLRDLDAGRRRVHIHENAVTVNGRIETGTPKSHVARSVPFPDFLDDVMQALIVGKAIDELVFGDGKQHMLSPNSQNGWFAAAVRRAMAIDPTFQRVTPHDLRHTAASLAVSAGANVKALQRMLGHASAAMTLDRYADLFDDDLDYVAAALSNARRAEVKLDRPAASRLIRAGTEFVMLPPPTSGLSI
ncbi:tyrosine-type recombinase/integrase [Microbacterium sulfonylureivorans]|uniref:tyrosine-type recombinase/integrase n=1 Tax=Microbacterium sulfonylureivorans TaxID=2486854 RepID=UPI000FDB08CE|nr:site-specific integrase [Microbacterium sulfonylureivorans]